MTDPSATVQVIATVLGIKGQPGRTLAESVVEALQFRHTLLVLDNCEHLIGEAANLAAEILEHCPEVTLLATSREALMIDGEQAWPVPSLAFRDGFASPAVTLFAERARAVVPSFDNAADPGAVTEICRRLDGIPLAIELAAARVRSMSPAQIRDRLDERFRLLTGGSRRALERHQTLRHAVQWSYDLLNDDEKRLLRRLSVFAGGFGLEAAEAVGGADLAGSVDAVDLLDSLVRKSLVTTERSGADVRRPGQALDARGSVHRGAEEVGLLADHLAGVEADAKAQPGCGPCPVAFVEGTLDVGRALDATPGGGEGNHEAVAEALDLAPVVAGDQLAAELVAGAHQLARRLVPPGRGQLRRPLHVREENGDRAFGQLRRHRARRAARIIHAEPARLAVIHVPPCVPALRTVTRRSGARVPGPPRCVLLL